MVRNHSSKAYKLSMAVQYTMHKVRFSVLEQLASCRSMHSKIAYSFMTITCEYKS